MPTALLAIASSLLLLACSSSEGGADGDVDAGVDGDGDVDADVDSDADADGDSGSDAGIDADGGVDAGADSGDGDAGTVTPAEGEGLLFTDLVSAPVGAYVTIWGLGLGSSGTVRLGGAGCEVLSWGRVDAGNGLEMIELVVPGTGSGLTVDGLDGALPFTGRTTGSIYFVDHDAADDSGSGTEEDPWKTLGQARRTMEPGDVTYVREASIPYEELDANGADADYEAMVLFRSGGTAELPIALAAYPGESPLLDAGAANARRGVWLVGSTSYVTVSKLRLTGGRSVAIGTTGGAELHVGIRIVGNAATAFVPGNTGVFSVNATRALRVLGNHIYDSGVEGENNSHMLYHGGFNPANEDVEMAYNQIHGEVGGRLIQVYGHRDDDRMTGLHIHHNVLYDGPYDAVLVSMSDGADNAWIEDAHIHHNVIHGLGRSGIQLNNPGCAFDVHDNTVSESTRSIWINRAASAEVYDNCLDLAVEDGVGTAEVDVHDNRTDFPSCAE